MAKKMTFEVPDDFDLENLPPGWKIVSPGKGGRPRLDLKRIGIAMAHGWRTVHCGENISKATGWVCSHWQHHGVHDEARARERFKEGRGLLNGCVAFGLSKGVMCFKQPMRAGSRVWLWNLDLHEAVEIEVGNAKGTVELDGPGSPNPLAAAAFAAFAMPR